MIGFHVHRSAQCSEVVVNYEGLIQQMRILALHAYSKKCYVEN